MAVIRTVRTTIIAAITIVIPMRPTMMTSHLLAFVAMESMAPQAHGYETPLSLVSFGTKLFAVVFVQGATGATGPEVHPPSEMHFIP